MDTGRGQTEDRQKTGRGQAVDPGTAPVWRCTAVSGQRSEQSVIVTAEQEGTVLPERRIAPYSVHSLTARMSHEHDPQSGELLPCLCCVLPGRSEGLSVHHQYAR